MAISYYSLEISGKHRTKCPVLCLSKRVESNYIPIPDWFAFSKEREDLLKRIDVARLQVPWDQKQELAFFIGAANGSTQLTSLENVMNNNRIQLALFSVARPDLVYAKLLSLSMPHICPEGRALDALLCHHKRISEEDSCIYKYLIDADGWGSLFLSSSMGYALWFCFNQGKNRSCECAMVSCRPTALC